jgi:hypothetical protein
VFHSFLRKHFAKVRFRAARYQKLDRQISAQDGINEKCKYLLLNFVAVAFVKAIQNDYGNE